jgi:hypothetical protein
VTRHERKVGQFAWRLLEEFPEWDTDQAFRAAESIVTHSEQMQFQMDVEADLDRLPMVQAA